jgi:RecB family endonuclease NucS
MKLSRVGEMWQFDNEYVLEDLVWHHLLALLNLQPFKRQFSVRGQFCDILAIDHDHQLVVIELKNVEDRYVVQQLTRYYDALKQEKPFGAEVNWDKPIRLIAIAPSFHPDTNTDCLYNRLDIERITFSLEEIEQRIYLKLTCHNGNILSKLAIPRHTENPTAEIAIASPPRKLLNWLSHDSETKFQKLINVREQIIGFDQRMREVIEPQAIIYGKGKTNPCAEIRRQNLGASSKSPKWSTTLFLWLPDLDGSSRIFRMMIWPDNNWEVVKTVLHSPVACKTKRFWHFPQCLKFMHKRNLDTLQRYERVISADGKSCLLPELVDLALQMWLNRI